MQKVQNAAEIKQRVINLVKLYRRKAGWESQTAKDAKADLESWNQMSYDMMVEEGFTGGGLYGEGPHTEGWIKTNSSFCRLKPRPKYDEHRCFKSSSYLQP